MAKQDHIKLLKKAQTRLGSAIKRLNQAHEFMTQFRAALPSHLRNKKKHWYAIPPELYLAFDIRGNIVNVRRQVLRLVFQIQLVHYLERRKGYTLGDVYEKIKAANEARIEEMTAQAMKELEAEAGETVETEQEEAEAE